MFGRQWTRGFLEDSALQNLIKFLEVILRMIGLIKLAFTDGNVTRGLYCIYSHIGKNGEVWERKGWQ